METNSEVNSEGQEPTPKSSISCSQEDFVIQLLVEDPELGEVLNLEATTTKPDDIQEGELQPDLDLCQDQVNKPLHAKVMEGDTTTIIRTLLEVESEHNERQLREKCLGVPIILRRILEQLSNKELIDLSLVNKLWNYEARSVLRDRCCLRASVDSGPVCRGLLELASDLEQMRMVPFTGIRVDIEHSADERDTCQPAPVGSLDPSYQVILDRLPLKHLSFRLTPEWVDCNECPAVVLVKRILEDHCGRLEELTMDYLDNKQVEFVQSIIQDRSFPCLKTFKLSLSNSWNFLPIGFARELVSSAPNLERFYFHLPSIYVENFMEGSSALLVVDVLNPLYTVVCDSLISALRTEKICVQCHGNSDVELLNRFVPMAIEASRNTLKSLVMDLLFAVPLMCYGMCLENVSKLCINLNLIVRNIGRDILALVKAFDFTRVFPKLNKVRICDPHDPGALSEDQISAFVERGNAMLREALPDRAINIKHLKLADISFGHSTALLLADMFPHVTKLSVAIRTWRKLRFTFIWEYFGGLTELHVAFRSLSSPELENWDSLFCGIFPEEVAELRAKDDEYLKAVNIVPVMPSITCMKGLRQFTLRYQPGAGENSKDPTRMFSKVTGLIGFLRCPTLSVKFRTPSHAPAVLEHMKPYVTLN